MRAYPWVSQQCSIVLFVLTPISDVSHSSPKAYSRPIEPHAHSRSSRGRLLTSEPAVSTGTVATPDLALALRLSPCGGLPVLLEVGSERAALSGADPLPTLIEDHGPVMLAFGPGAVRLRIGLLAGK